MELSCERNVITITGNIKSIADFQAIKTSVDDLIEEESQLHFIIKDSISMTSSVIGYFTKLVYQDKIIMTMSVGDERLYQLLEELKITSLFGVRRN